MNFGLKALGTVHLYLQDHNIHAKYSGSGVQRIREICDGIKFQISAAVARKGFKSRYG